MITQKIGKNYLKNLIIRVIIIGLLYHKKYEIKNIFRDNR